MYTYIPTNELKEKKMLGFLGHDDVEELFADIPEDLRLKDGLNIPKGLSEPELSKFITSLANKNKTIDEQVCFVGAGAYDRYIPSVISHLVSRSEFYTAYTPYQPEISQGTLQAIFEFQSMIAELTGMDVANASMYDGSSACAEAVLLAVKHTKNKKILMSEAVHPEIKAVVNTYGRFNNINIIPICTDNGITDVEDLDKHMEDDVGGVIIQSPNFFGQIEDLAKLEPVIHRGKTLMITAISDPLAYTILKTPGTSGSDIVVGEGQSLGLNLNFGGPYLGFMCSTEKLMRKMPGRIVGETTDVDGNRAFVLTLQAREQHIRREKATSNICSNQGLNALIATIYMSVMGKDGLNEVAKQSMSKAVYTVNQLKKIGIKPYFSGAFFDEFVVDLGTDATKVYEGLSEKDILCGLPLEKYVSSSDMDNPQNKLLICVTEKRTKQEIDTLVDSLERMVK